MEGRSALFNRVSPLLLGQQPFFGGIDPDLSELIRMYLFLSNDNFGNNINQNQQSNSNFRTLLGNDFSNNVLSGVPKFNSPLQDLNFHLNQNVLSQLQPFNPIMQRLLSPSPQISSPFNQVSPLLNGNTGLLNQPQLSLLLQDRSQQLQQQPHQQLFNLNPNHRLIDNNSRDFTARSTGRGHSTNHNHGEHHVRNFLFPRNKK